MKQLKEMALRLVREEEGKVLQNGVDPSDLP